MLKVDGIVIVFNGGKQRSQPVVMERLIAEGHRSTKVIVGDTKLYKGSI